MDAALKHTLATYADIEALPPHVTGQIVDGELYASPRPARSHGVAASRLGGILSTAFDLAMNGPGGWCIIDEPELHLGDSVLVPDMAGWRINRWPGAAAGHGIQVAPDWICEVLSPSTERFDRIAKMMAYARAGVSYAWLVHPTRHTVEIFERVDTRWTFCAGFSELESLCAVPFEAITIPLGKIWLNPPTPDAAPSAAEQAPPDEA